jgi:hypothetical protein
MNFIPTIICDLANELEVIANLALIFFTITFLYKRTYMEINLSCGTFRVMRKDVNASNLTNLTSGLFYQGNHIPPHVRGEIMSITNPPVKGVISK